MRRIAPMIALVVALIAPAFAQKVTTLDVKPLALNESMERAADLAARMSHPKTASLHFRNYFL